MTDAFALSAKAQARRLIVGANTGNSRRELVPLAGIEPALLAELDFESSASTNSAIGAQAGRPGWARTIRLEACSSTGQFLARDQTSPFCFVKLQPLCSAENLSR